MLQLQPPLGCTLAFHQGKGWCPAVRHINACEAAIADGCNYICILGADQVYDPDLICRLFDRIQQGCDVISALVPTRGYLEHMNMRPFQRMAWRLKCDGSILYEWDRSNLQCIQPNDGPLQEIDFIGSGVIMFPTELLLSLDRPWFFEEVDHETQARIACMDTRFCWRLKMEGGARVWCDTTIEVRHIHDMEIDKTFENRFLDWADNPGDPNICTYGTPHVKEVLQENQT
jgi:GT2 family glycosyltransferase